MRRTLSFSFITVVLILFFSYLSAEDYKPKLAVMEISAEDDLFTPKELENAVEYLRGKLASSGEYIVIAKERQENSRQP